jgi:hypothetical protein
MSGILLRRTPETLQTERPLGLGGVTDSLDSEERLQVCEWLVQPGVADGSLGTKPTAAH